MSDIAGQMAEWRKTVWGTGPCPDSSQKNFTLTDEEREAIWTVAEAYAENDGDPECERIAKIMQGLWQRTK